MDGYLVCVPTIAPREMTAAARRHYDIDSPRLLCVDNSPTGEYAEGPWLYHHENGRNLGVAASWNVGLSYDADITIFLSSYLELDDGLAKTADRLCEAANEYGCVTWAAMHCFAMTRKTVEICGLFDENFKVAYFEDTDMIRRWDLGGCHNGENPMPKIAIPGSCPQAKTMTSGLVTPPMDKNRSRFLAKWGGEFNHEVFETPFNDLSLTIKDWGPE